jgi:hypothetical protein
VPKRIEPPKADAEPSAVAKLPPAEAVERIAAWLLGNRFVWLAFSCCLFLLLALSFIQWQSGQAMKPRFDTMVLLANLMVVKEAGLLVIAMLLLGSLPGIQQRWQQHFPGLRFSLPLFAVAFMLTTVLADALLLTPLLVLHSYPQLAQEGLHVPLTLLQRDILQLVLLFVAVNCAFIVVLYTRLPSALTALFTPLLYCCGGLLLAYASTVQPWAWRLNDVFFYNQLWQYIDGFPNWERPEVYHNIQGGATPYLLYYFTVGVGVAAVTFLLWTPRAFHTAAQSQLKS